MQVRSILINQEFISAQKGLNTITSVAFFFFFLVRPIEVPQENKNSLAQVTFSKSKVLLVADGRMMVPGLVSGPLDGAAVHHGPLSPLADSESPSGKGAGLDSL